MTGQRAEYGDELLQVDLCAGRGDTADQIADELVELIENE